MGATGLVLLNFEPVHRLLNPLGFAAVGWLFFCVARRLRIALDTCPLPPVRLGPPCRRPILNAAKPKGFRRRCTSDSQGSFHCEQRCHVTVRKQSQKATHTKKKLILLICQNNIASSVSR